MLQEAIQNYKIKHNRIDFDTAATFQSDYLFNLVGDNFYKKENVQIIDMDKGFVHKDDN